MIYTVRQGDTLWKIARRYGITVSQLLEANPGIDPNGLVIGSQLNIPKQNPSFTMYRVQAGDSLYLISQKYGIPIQVIATANALSEPYELMVGQWLVIPGITQPKPTTVPQNTFVYTVKSGDTLNSIARRFNTTVPVLVSLNNIADPNVIFAGQQLLIPLQTTQLPTTPVPTTPMPTLIPPTTPMPTLVPPTTMVPTTMVPTTMVPTTMVPTTIVPTTVVPTTMVPTTAVPTTMVPTTAVPTTLLPTTTAVPTTIGPTATVPPTTITPTYPPTTTTMAPTLPPTTIAPTICPPTTTAPTTHVPTICPTIKPTASVPPTTIYPGYPDYPYYDYICDLETYCIEAGDTLSSIAAKYQTTVENLCALNCITDPYVIDVGQTIYIPVYRNH